MKKTIISLFVLCYFISVASAQQETTGRFFTSFDGTKIYYEVKGDGYPVILIHGFSGTGQGWKHGKLYGDLLTVGYKVIILDQRGNGQSDKPHTDEGYANDAEAKDIIGLITALHIEKYNVVGYSRGTTIASRLLIKDKRVNKTVLGGMGADFTNPEWPRRIHAYRALMGDTSYHDVDGMINYIKSQHLDELTLALQQKYQPSTSKEEFAKVKKPVLIIRGTEDKDSETVLQQMIPGSKLVYVPGNHNTASPTPEFSAAVTDFFK